VEEVGNMNTAMQVVKVKVDTGHEDFTSQGCHNSQQPPVPGKSQEAGSPMELQPCCHLGLGLSASDP
jgi:hypothetical protein